MSRFLQKTQKVAPLSSAADEGVISTNGEAKMNLTGIRRLLYGLSGFLILSNAYSLYWSGESFNTESVSITMMIVVLMIIIADAVRRIEVRLKKLEAN